MDIDLDQDAEGVPDPRAGTIFAFGPDARPGVATLAGGVAPVPVSSSLVFAGLGMGAFGVMARTARNRRLKAAANSRTGGDACSITFGQGSQPMATIVSDAHRFVFVHIPKCAGMSISVQMRQKGIDWDTRFVGKPLYEHPRYGDMMLAHLPLDVPGEVFPDTLEKYRVYDSYARDLLLAAGSGVSARILRSRLRALGGGLRRVRCQAS